MAQKPVKAAGPGNVHLPVITSVDIDGYPVYPGTADKPGLHHEFQDGVSVIVGINGQGKTTLLNVLYRMLVGARDQSKSDLLNPGTKRHALIELRNFSYFSARIRGDANVATVTLRCKFGSEEVRITRTLGPALAIKEIWRGKTKLAEPSEERWYELCRELTGLGSDYDYVFVVRNLLFFLEDKVPLLWNPSGQFEILRILFLGHEMAARCVDLQDTILREDSLYRNLDWQTNSVRQSLERAKKDFAALGDVATATEALAVSTARLDAKRIAIEDLETAIRDVLNGIGSLEARLFQKEIELHDAIAVLELEEATAIQGLLPDAHGAAQLLYTGLLANQACLLCGSQNHTASAHIRNLLAQDRCPACTTPIAKARKTSRRRPTLGPSEEKVMALREELERDRAELAKRKTALSDSLQRRATEQREISDLEVQVSRAKGDIEALPEQVRNLTRQLTEHNAVLQEKGRFLKAQRAAYETVLEGADDIIRKVAKEISKRFQHYADRFLLENAGLDYSFHARPIGQSGQRLNFPHFVLKLGSAFTDDLSERAEADEVSESQKEFVDLAFRMALLDVAISKFGPGMIVIETPESSLDTVFVERAGSMLRQFGIGRSGNRVIATCNVNGEEMIGWLLGTRPKPVPKSQRASVEARVINLMRVAATPASYKAERLKYERAYEDALFGS